MSTTKPLDATPPVVVGPAAAEASSGGGGGGGGGGAVDTRLPVTIISGFLGCEWCFASRERGCAHDRVGAAGKTTLLQRILDGRADMRVVRVH